MMRITLHLPEELDEAAREAASGHEGVTRSEVLRDWLKEGYDACDQYDVPPWLDLDVARERIKRQNRVADLRGGFRGRAVQQLQRRFRNGYRVDDIESYADGLKREARLLFAGGRADDEVAFVEEKVDEYREASRLSEYDPHGEAFEAFEGVADGQESPEEARHQRMVEAAADMLRDDAPAGRVESVLMRRFDVAKGPASDALNDAYEEVDR